MQITRLALTATPTAFATFADKDPAPTGGVRWGYRDRPTMQTRRDVWLAGRP